MKNKKNASLMIVAATMVASSMTYADVKLSGQVNQRAIIGGDLKDDISVADNTMTGTRFRFTGDTKSGGITAGFRYEIQLRANNSAAPGSTTEEESPTFKGDGTGGFSDSEVRWQDVFVKGAFGKVSIGRGEPAASNTADATYGNGNFYSTPNLVWLAYNGAAIDEGEAGGTGARGFDGETGRTSRIQYDSPKFSGFSFAVSLGNDDNQQLAIRYEGKVGPGKLKVRYGQVEVDNTDKARTVADVDAGGVRAVGTNVERSVASFLYQFNFGLNFGGSMGTDDVNDQNDYEHFALGWKKGKIGASIEVLEEDNGDEVTSTGISYKVAKGATAYLNYASYDNDAADNDFDGMMVGLHVKF